MKAAAKESLEAIESVLAAVEAAGVGGGAAGSEDNLEAAPTSTIMDKLQTLATPTLEVSVSAPKCPACSIGCLGTLY